jgi:ParB-like chromosome segregation protein Spo0J
MKTIQLPLEKLIAYAGNPRKNDHAVETVASAIKRFGFRVPVLAKSDGSLIDGHLRVKAAKHLGMKDVPVVLCDDLSEADIKALRISINRMAELAEWDTELLSTELEGLAAEGFTLDDVGFDADSLEELGVNDDIFEDKDNPYTAKVEAPIYKPTGKKPEVQELCDQDKFKLLLQSIKASGLSQEQKAFLELAAARHIVFDYQQIAEYYAHADAELQKLMEHSALIIIDFNKAIEAGFVKLTERVADQFKQDIEDE